MFFVELDTLTQLSGITGVIGLCIVLFFSALVLHEAIKKKQRILYMFFIAIIFTVSPWFPSDIGYIYWLITKEEIEYQIYVFIGTIGLPIAMLAWLDIYMSIMYPKSKKKILIGYTLFSLSFYWYIIYFLFFDPNAPVKEMIGYKRTPLDINYKGYVLFYMGICILIGTITGMHFSIVSMRIEKNPLVHWKGRFLLVSFILFAVGAVGDALIELTPFTLILIKVVLILSSFFYYIGFMMPKWMIKILSIE